MCRSAQIGIMGTVLTTNCTCLNIHNENEHQQCTQAKRRLQHHNVCMGGYTCLQTYFTGQTRFNLIDDSHVLKGRIFNVMFFMSYRIFSIQIKHKTSGMSFH